MRLIDADLLELDTEWSEYMDGFTSYSQLQIDNAPTIEVEPVQKQKMIEADRKKCEEWCKDCEHIEMCKWYPFGGCEFRLLPKLEQSTIKPEVRQGRWIDNGEDKYICSACKGYVYRWFGRSDFCPRCGAKMCRGVLKMFELIDRQSVLEIAMSYCPDDDGCCSKAGHDLREMLDEIEALPAIKHEVWNGRWIPTEYDSYADGAPVWDKWECSECGHEHNGGEDTLTAFCPNCGAPMDETDMNDRGKGVDV